MRVLGVDPGLRITGYGCIEPGGDGYRIVEAGVFRLVRRDDSGETASVSSRLVELDRDFRDLLERVNPDVVAIEGLFAHYKHPATAIVMGHARGVLLLAVERRGMRLVELKPTEIKKSLVGWGRADKSQVQRAIQAEFKLPEPPTPPDLADALGIALCAAHRVGLEDFRS